MHACVCLFAYECAFSCVSVSQSECLLIHELTMNDLSEQCCSLMLTIEEHGAGVSGEGGP